MDIRVNASFKGHRKRKRLKALLGDDATDYILDLWISTAQNHPNGLLERMDELDISLEAGWDKDPSTFVDALLQCQLLDKVEGGYALHDWAEHQPWVVHAPDRTAKARKAAEVRWGQPKHATSMLRASIENAQGNAPSPIPSPTPNHIPYAVIVGYLNEVCSKEYKPQTKDTQKHIRARWNDGYKLEDFKKVIDNMRKKWGGDPKMCDFLRPQTLFGSKFESYLQNTDITEPKLEPVNWTT